MAEASRSHPSQYVRLNKDQDASASGPGLEDIRPGELNLPVIVPQLRERKCTECGQVLPPDNRALADEPWTTGIFGCAEDPESCWTGLFCPCVLFRRNVQALSEDIPWTLPCICHAVCVEGGIALAILTSIFHGVDPDMSIQIGESLVCGWWMCSHYTSIVREKLQKKRAVWSLHVPYRTRRVVRPPVIRRPARRTYATSPTRRRFGWKKNLTLSRRLRRRDSVAATSPTCPPPTRLRRRRESSTRRLRRRRLVSAAAGTPPHTSPPAT
ncbi:hypothetical protein ZWY2020_042948 [Hordeum vulgare]|nr:hypothetical protein ZWY2020_042948 [Hordeum vulgare]